MHTREAHVVSSAARLPRLGLGSGLGLRLRLGWRARWDVPLVVAVALLARVGHACAIAGTPYFLGPIIDAKTYHELALGIAQHGDFGAAFYQPPLYPTLWALFISLGIDVGWPLALAHALAGTVTAVLFYAIGSLTAVRAGRADERRIALGCGLAAALYGPFILYDLEYLPPAWVHLLLALAWVTALSSGAAVKLRDLWIGLLIGLAATAWTLCAVFMLPIAIVRASDVRGARPRLVLAALLLLGAAAPVAVVARHNAQAGSPGVLVSWNGGLNFWLGNNPDWRDTWKARPGPGFEAVYEKPELAGHVTPLERDRDYYQSALEDICERPWAAVERTGEKLYYFWHGRELRRNQDFETLREASPLLRALSWEHGLFFPFGLVAPLALLACVRRRHEVVTRATIVASLAYSGLVAAHIVATRYRLPLLVWLLPLAVREAVELVSAPSPRWALPSLAILGVALNWPVAFTASLRADDVERGVLRVHALQAQPYDEGAEGADRESAELLRRWPEDPTVLVLRADFVHRTQGCSRALPLLARALEHAPSSTSLRVQRADCYVELGLYDQAEQELRVALARNPNSGLALKQAALLFARAGRRYEASWLAGRFHELGHRDDELDAVMAELSTLKVASSH